MCESIPSASRRRLVITSAAAALAAAASPASFASLASAATRSARAGASRDDAEPAFAPMLASVYHGQAEPERCLVSEKYDGVRALWDGRVLRHRSGRPVSAPMTFLASLPASPLDGELWLGRGTFDALSAIVRRGVPSAADWRDVRYMAFELPGAGGTFAERAARIARLAADRPHGSPARVEAAPQLPCASADDLRRRLDAVVAGGGEGLVLHVATAPESSGRSDWVMKLKPHLDAEAIVVGFRPGQGRLAGRLGALEVETPDGIRFLLGSGFSDAQRASPPPVGAQVTYRYRDVTPRGVPRFATFVRVAETP